MRHAQTILLAIALVFSLAAGAAAEDLTVVSTVTPPQGAPTKSTQYISKTKVRTSDGTTDTILDIATGRMLFVDHKKESFYETSFDEIRARFDELEKVFEANPAMGKLVGDAKGVDVEKRSGTREIAGYTCHEYKLSFGPSIVFDVWAAPDLEPPAEYFDGRKLHYASVGPFASRFEAIVEEMKKIGGFPLATTVETNLLGVNMHSETEATEVKVGPIPPETFEAPSGYQQIKSPYRKK